MASKKKIQAVDLLGDDSMVSAPVAVDVPVVAPVAVADSVADAVDLSIVGVVSAFEKAFAVCNDKYFSGLVARPVITIAQGAKVRAYGWVSVAPVWHEIQGEKKAHELNISSEYLSRDFLEVVTTLMHEIVHLENLRNGVQDVARSGSRHNKKFADCADAHGMTGYKDEDFSRVGFKAKLTEETAADLILSLAFLKDAITLSRDVNPDKIKGKKSNVLKYACPCCGSSVRATKEIAILCIECDEAMQLEN